MNSKEFSLEIEKIVKEKRDLTYMDAVIWYCEQNDIELSTVNPLISKTLKQKIELESQKLNFLPKTGVLPV